MEEEPREEDQEENLTEGTADIDQNSVEQTGSNKGATIPLRKKRKKTEIEKLRRERIKLHKLVEQLRQTIRVLRMK